MAEERQQRRNEKEYLVPPGSYMYVQDGTGGKVKTFVGPIQVSLTGNDAPMIYEHVDGLSGNYKVIESLEASIRKNIVVPEGHYVVLTNPAVNKEGKISPPGEGGLASATPDLQIGSKVIMRGPCTFPLWPGQAAQVIPGHNLRSNQYVLCRVYNQTQAQKNWGDVFMVRATPKPAALPTGESGAGETPAAADAAAAAAEVEATAEMTAEQLIEGKLFIIRGTQASFYIPPTGVAVVADEKGAYVREAVTLEQLEYSVLIDEAGTKRYVRGPAVVFPQPTEKFMLGEKGEIKTRAIEMNNIQGIHIKATRDHHDPVLGDLKEGEERFITGKDYPIYYPREEQVLVRYDGKDKHFAVAVTEGRGRYVMDRMTGVVKLALGPTMLLPNPVAEIIVRRALTRQQCELWYPGNALVLAYNEDLAGAAAKSPTTRTGVVSEGDVERYASSNQMRGPVTKGLMEHSGVTSSKARAIGDEMTRSSTFNAPRTLVLNDTFEGAPGISPWTGYAVMVVDSKGDRRVEVGPTNILLEFDEVLEILTLSTSKPKNTDVLYYTPYLHVDNNNVGDIITVETSDNVLISVKVSYLVNFEGEGEERLKWFAVQNYVKMLCDRMRSRLKATVKSLTVEKFYGDSTDIIRKVVLGQDEAGTTFDENNMVVSEVEVLDVSIQDKDVERLLRDTQKATVQRNIRIASKRRDVAAEIEEGKLTVESATADATVKQAKNELEAKVLANSLVLMLAKLEAMVKEQAGRKAAAVAEQEVLDLLSTTGLARETKERTEHARLDEIERTVELEIDIKRLVAEADAQVKRLTAVAGGFSEALLALGSQDALVKITQAGSIQKMLGGDNALDVIGQMFQSTGLGKMLETISKRAGLPAIPNGTPTGAPAPAAR